MADRFGRMAHWSANAVGTPGAFLLAALVVLVWALTGPLFRFSDTWQLVINTGTTIVTFLMVFLIQNAQNRDARALHTKLDALLKENDRISDALLGLEDAPEERLRAAAKEIRDA